jgi:hypothetical protein
MGGPVLLEILGKVVLVTMAVLFYGAAATVIGPAIWQDIQYRDYVLAGFRVGFTIMLAAIALAMLVIAFS